jgi:hypothetical protein
MKNAYPVFFCIVLTILAEKNVGAQGCSDAGFCTIHSLKNNTGETISRKNELLLGFGFGKGERSISYYNPYIEYTRRLSPRTSATGKVVYAIIDGELAGTNGLGDLYFSLSHVFDAKSSWKKSFIAGLKIPLDNSDIKKNGIELPMPYQPSLGTVDIVLGLSFTKNSFGASAALQQPVSGANDNTFLPGDYPSVPLASNYWPNNGFERKGDVLLRASYNFGLNDNFSIRPSLLGIYHLGNDSYLDDNKMRRAIYNSKGLTLNGNVFFDFSFKNGNALELSLGSPFVVRDQRPDGLTRSFVAALEYKFRF